MSATIYILILHVSITINIYKERFEHLWQECDACVCLESSFKVMGTSLLRLHAGNKQQLSFSFINHTIITQHTTSSYTSNNAVDDPLYIKQHPRAFIKYHGDSVSSFPLTAHPLVTMLALMHLIDWQTDNSIAIVFPNNPLASTSTRLMYTCPFRPIIDSLS